jgi:hypothetical protein
MPHTAGQPQCREGSLGVLTEELNSRGLICQASLEDWKASSMLHDTIVRA